MLDGKSTSLRTNLGYRWKVSSQIPHGVVTASGYVEFLAKGTVAPEDWIGVRHAATERLSRAKAIRAEVVDDRCDQHHHCQTQARSTHRHTLPAVPAARVALRQLCRAFRQHPTRPVQEPPGRIPVIRSDPQRRAASDRQLCPQGHVRARELLASGLQRDPRQSRAAANWP
jgi:hypothetical protein